MSKFPILGMPILPPNPTGPVPKSGNPGLTSPWSGNSGPSNTGLGGLANFYPSGASPV